MSQQAPDAVITLRKRCGGRLCNICAASSVHMHCDMARKYVCKMYNLRICPLHRKSDTTTSKLFFYLITKLREEAPAKKKTMPLATNANVSQKDSKAPDSTSLGEMSNLLVAAPYSPKTATATTPARAQGSDSMPAPSCMSQDM